MTTHVALVARAFGADEVVICGDNDASLEKSVKAVVGNWGGDFRIRHEKDFVKFLKERKNSGCKVVHLTMYGEMVQDAVERVRKCKDLVVIVGSQKVPMEAYREADFNISVTTQPHSEIAALAIFLDRYFDGAQLSRKIEGKLRIIPSKFGKNVLSCDERGQV
jgi:tRNA (cytidine56-2'-O)-methyltransferase